MESDASIATWTASFDINNLPHDAYFGSPGVEGPLNFSRYNIDDNNGIRTNLKNFKYRVEYYWKSDQTTTTDQVVSIDLYNAPLFEKTIFGFGLEKPDNSIIQFLIAKNSLESIFTSLCDAWFRLLDKLHLLLRREMELICLQWEYSWLWWWPD